MCGSPTFTGHTTTAFTGEGTPLKRYRVNTGGSCTGSPSFVGADPSYATDIQMPPTNKALKNETVNVSGNQGGCLYTGPTRIRFESNGTMTVKSPYSKQTNNACPTNGNGALPKNGVIFVQNVISSPSSDANYWNPSTACPNSTYTAATKTWTSASGSYTSPAHPLGYPITISGNSDQNSEYDCRAGDAFVDGTLDGQITIAAENNVDVIGNLVYKDGVGGDDLLGLIADQYVEIYHPVDCTNVDPSCEMDADVPSRARFNGSSFSPTSEPSSSWDRPVFKDPAVNAAILSLQHSFRVQQYNIGDKSQLGSLHVTGAIAREVPWRRRHDQQHRVPEGLRLRQPAAVLVAAQVPRPGEGLVGRGDLGRGQDAGRIQLTDPRDTAGSIRPCLRVEMCSARRYGTRDVLPPESDRWQALTARFATRATRAGFGLLVTPMFEHIEVVQKLGSSTDVVRKELYDFEDKGGRVLALRADGTASVVRAFVQHRPVLPWKVWYVAPNFRYERPQAGRYRQHWQVGVEVLGVEDPGVDVEVIALAQGFYRELGLQRFRLLVNSMGDGASRARLPRGPARVLARPQGPAGRRDGARGDESVAHPGLEA